MGLEHDQKDVDRMVDEVSKNLKTWMMNGIARGMDEIGILATSKHMINPGGKGRPVDSKRITSRSGRTARSLLPQGGAFSARGSREQIRTIKASGNKVQGDFGSKVEYLDTHESGMTIVQTVTARQIAMFWAKWYETEQDMWKAAALKYTYKEKTLTIDVKARPVLEPAIAQGSDAVFAIMAKAVLGEL